MQQWQGEGRVRGGEESPGDLLFSAGVTVHGWQGLVSKFSLHPWTRLRVSYKEQLHIYQLPCILMPYISYHIFWHDPVGGMHVRYVL